MKKNVDKQAIDAIMRSVTPTLPPLTKQENVFVQVVAETGNRTKAAKKAFGIKDDNYAGLKGSRMIRKDKIVKTLKSMADHLPIELLAENHLKLFKQKQVSYFVFPRNMKDAEIVGHVKAAGIDVITVRESDKGKMAFYSIPDTNAISRGLDFAYKIKGDFAPEKKVAVNLNVTQELEETAFEAISNFIGYDNSTRHNQERE